VKKLWTHYVVNTLNHTQLASIDCTGILIFQQLFAKCLLIHAGVPNFCLCHEKVYSFAVVITLWRQVSFNDGVCSRKRCERCKRKIHCFKLQKQRPTPKLSLEEYLCYARCFITLYMWFAPDECRLVQHANVSWVVVWLKTKERSFFPEYMTMDHGTKVF